MNIAWRLTSCLVMNATLAASIRCVMSYAELCSNIIGCASHIYDGACVIQPVMFCIIAVAHVCSPVGWMLHFFSTITPKLKYGCQPVEMEAYSIVCALNMHWLARHSYVFFKV
jgi:hypothetical protein